MNSTLFQVGFDQHLHYFPTFLMCTLKFTVAFLVECCEKTNFRKLCVPAYIMDCVVWLYGCVNGRYSEHWSKTLVDKLTLMFVGIRKQIIKWGTFLVVSLFAKRNLVQFPFSRLLCNRKWKEFFGGFEFFFFMEVTVKIIILWNVVPCLTGRYQNVVISKNSVIFMSLIAWTYCPHTDWNIARCT